MHMQLNEAFLCLDCNALNDNSQQCEACASEALVALAKFLNREEEKEEVTA